MVLDLVKINRDLADKSPEEIVRWAIGLKRKMIATTKFGPQSAALLHLVTQQQADLPVLWADHGYNTKSTYLFVEKLQQHLDLNLKVYTPEISSARRDALLGGVPEVGDKHHQQFTQQVKIEPFKRAFEDLQPQLWLTGIRRDQTEFRKSLDVVTLTQTGIYKIAPLFYYSDADIDVYIEEHELPVEKDYFDPTKVLSHRECGLHYSI